MPKNFKVSKTKVKKNIGKGIEFHTGRIGLIDFNKIEQGKTNITFRTFLKIAKGLGKHPKDLFDFEFDIKKYKIKD